MRTSGYPVRVFVSKNQGFSLTSIRVTFSSDDDAWIAVVKAVFRKALKDGLFLNDFIRSKQ